MAGAAPKLTALLNEVTGAALPVRIRCWDGSESGPTGAPVLVIRSRTALRRLLWQPDELGFSQAYVAGELDIEGDMTTALQHFWGAIRELGVAKPEIGVRTRLRAASLLLRLGAVGPRPTAPGEEARLKGLLHSKTRDRDAISHHYDLSNDFYHLLLDEHMAYSCAYYTQAPGSAGYTLHDAQTDKLDLVCRKLGLQPGQRLLDVGCGWGSMILHAAEHYGVHATGVTISSEQRDFIEKRVAERGLQGKVTVRLQDYREVSDGPYDAISTIEMGEHVGAENYDVYTATLYRLLKPRGRLLLQQMSRVDNPGGGAFIESYIAPDMTMVPLGTTANNIEKAGFEIRDVHVMREHYVHTIRAWLDTFESRIDEVVAMIGVGQSRVWRLYIVGSALAFEENRMGVDQFLAVKPDVEGVSGIPRTRDEWSVGVVR
ncbi:cyclopropane-fatty-acyl-phospholipid synthase family protein [Rhodococcus antarcticus]|uniref:Cyclopropane-fatty-acyl-phospholipid synthase family protein n=1 Tax=Rhodococcus antarcticus TaxID=2987751 RepID=A0ABY6NVZ7_9NOCA|nr:cyclopropane-fatty-acyl-phospholipid synthase family protein [Rhodococcus antarcticus]UZJ23478.1 cyclopropane-fatty-acyl-phospholipid synthase family protein [Rhodococcus antarcticus]